MKVMNMTMRDYDDFESWDDEDGVVPDGHSQYSWNGDPYSNEGHDDSNLYSDTWSRR